MQAVETQVQRWISLEKWFVDIFPLAPGELLQVHPTPPKRPVGRPRTKPLPDPTLPKRPVGRPRKIAMAKVPTIVGTI